MNISLTHKLTKIKTFLKKFSLLALCLILSLQLGACNLVDKVSNKQSEAENNKQEESSTIYRSFTDEDIAEIISYLESIVNGDFREISEFPYFDELEDIPAIVFSNGNLLQTAKNSLGEAKINREDYQEFLQSYFNPKITLPATADYQRAYDAENDQFNADTEPRTRNFIPETFWKEPSINQEGNTLFFEAYEFNYRYVNAETGLDETTNPIARVVIDDVTVGFSAPIVRNDLMLLDYHPLAKSRYKFQIKKDGKLNLLSKTLVEGDQQYKNSAQAVFANKEAVYGNIKLPKGSSNLQILAWTDDNSPLRGTLNDDMGIWYVDIFPEQNYLLLAPAAETEVFNYNYGFGFGKKNGIRGFAVDDDNEKGKGKEAEETTTATTTTATTTTAEESKD